MRTVVNITRLIIPVALFGFGCDHRNLLSPLPLSSTAEERGIFLRDVYPGWRAGARTPGYVLEPLSGFLGWRAGARETLGFTIYDLRFAICGF